MKAICPISGIPFRTYDSLPIKVSYPHPIFSLTYDQLISLLDIVGEQEKNVLESISKDTLGQNHEYLDEFYSKDFLSKKNLAQVLESIQERNFNNPHFKLYQTKHLTMLAFMKLAGLLDNEIGYMARPKPHIVEAYFWSATELFIWACAIRNPHTIELLPRYKISKHNQDMGNFSEYLDIFKEIKENIGLKYKTRNEEKRIASMQIALSILAKRRDQRKIELTSGTNKLAATWALMVTRPPKDMYDFWFAILSSSSTQITFEGVKINNKWERVTEGDLRELKDFLEDALIGPRGEDKSIKATHEDDSEYYFISRQTVLGIVRRHISILEQGTAGYQILNNALGADIVSATDDVLNEKAIAASLPSKPHISEYPKRLDFIKAMAKWRLGTKKELLDLSNMIVMEDTKPTNRKEVNYEIL